MPRARKSISSSSSRAAFSKAEFDLDFMASNWAVAAPAASINPDGHTKIPWPQQNDLTHGQLVTAGGAVVSPTVLVEVHCGIKWEDDDWIAYRRNYFSVVTAFLLDPIADKERLYLNGKPVQGFAMTVTSFCKENDGRRRNIELVQYTAKRDNATKVPVPKVKVLPGLPLAGLAEQSRSVDHTNHFSNSRQTHNSASAKYRPYLPYHDIPEPGFRPLKSSSHRFQAESTSLVDHGGNISAKQHTFERIQFKVATANNGKRRATQQYFNVSIELLADVRPDNGPAPVWKCITSKDSAPLIVRGRSPSHYLHEANKRRAKQAAGERERRVLMADSPASTNSTSGGTYTGQSGTIGDNSTTHYIGPFPDYNYHLRNNHGYKASVDSSTQSPPELSDTAHIETHYHEYGDDLKRDLDLESNMEGLENYKYCPGPLYHTVEGPTPRMAFYKQEDHQQTAFRHEYPRALSGQLWHFEQSGITGYETADSSQGFYPGKSYDFRRGA